MAGCELYPRPVVLTLLHLERRATGHWLVALQDAADERLSRKGPVSDGKHTGTQALVPWRAPGLNVPLVPGQEPALRSFIKECQWRESKAVSAPGVELEPTESTRTETAAGFAVRAPERAQPDTRARHARAPSTAESPGVTAAGSESAETTRPDTEQVSEKEPSPFVQRWRARFKRLHSSHG